MSILRIHPPTRTYIPTGISRLPLWKFHIYSLPFPTWWILALAIVFLFPTLYAQTHSSGAIRNYVTVLLERAPLFKKEKSRMLHTKKDVNIKNSIPYVMKLENYSILTLFRCQLLFRHFHNDTDILTRKKIDKYYILAKKRISYTLKMQTAILQQELFIDRS